MEYSLIPDSLNLENSTTKNGESSCTFYEICENAFPLPNQLMKGNNCNHRYCEECIQNYTGSKIKGKRTNIPRNYCKMVCRYPPLYFWEIGAPASKN
ncbi:hypothetical protein RDI58_007385 [Solanum bulbocastanum]|uniref:RING-type domain-containing protein n=1 Tax=Solanum bulbocastanum TaxID=147425 RepID=A0AAN8YIU5_SOLBU